MVWVAIAMPVAAGDCVIAHSTMTVPANSPFARDQMRSMLQEDFLVLQLGEQGQLWQSSKEAVLVAR